MCIMSFFICTVYFWIWIELIYQCELQCKLLGIINLNFNVIDEPVIKSAFVKYSAIMI